MDLEFNHEFPSDLSVMAGLYYDRNSLLIGYPLTRPPTPDLLSVEDQLGEWWGTELQFTKRLWDRHTITAGAEYRDDFHQEILVRNETLTDSRIASAVSGNRQSYGFYLQGDAEVRTNLHVNTGLRYDHFGAFGSSVNPRVALIYNPRPGSAVKAIFGTAFRAPNFFELSDPRFRDVIDREKIYSYELVYDLQLGQHLRPFVSAFYNRVDGLITFRDGRFQNVDDAEARGIETGLEGLWANGLRGRLGYTLQETEDRATGQRLHDSPVHLGKLNLSAPFYRNEVRADSEFPDRLINRNTETVLYRREVFAGVEFQYTSERTTWTGKEVSGFGLVNLTVFSQNLLKGLDLSASVYNLLDREYGDPATPRHLQDWIEQNGRTFRVKLTYRF